MRVIVHEITNEVILVSDDDTGFLAAPDDTMVFQCSEEKMIKIALALNLDLSQMPSIILSPELTRVYKDRSFGQKIFNRFLEENKRIVLSTEENVNQLTAFVNLKQLLEAGAIETARDLLLGSPSTAFVVVEPYLTSDERKQSFVNELNEYLANAEN